MRNIWIAPFKTFFFLDDSDMAYAWLRRTIIPRVLAHLGSIEGTEYLPSHGPFILAANHVSYLEPVLLALLVVDRTRERVWSLTKYPIWLLFRVLGLANWLGMVPVYPHEKGRSVAFALEKLRRGYPVLIFPEGTRSRDGKLLPAKTGAVRLALDSGAPVIPALYSGPPTRSTRETLRVFFRSSRSIRIRIGRPIRFEPTTTPPTHDELVRMTTRVMDEIGRLQSVTHEA